MGVSYASLQVIPDLVSSFFDLLPCFAAGLTQFLQFFGCRLLFGTQLMNCPGTVSYTHLTLPRIERSPSRGLGDVYKRQVFLTCSHVSPLALPSSFNFSDAACCLARNS